MEPPPPPPLADDGVIHTSASGFLLLNAGLAALSFLAFVIPSRLLLRERDGGSGMALVNALSAGVLVGCVLAIIIPEGFAAPASSDTGHGHGHGDGEGWGGLALLGGYVTQVLLDVVGQRLSGGGGHFHHHHYQHLAAKQSPRPDGPDDDGLEGEGNDDQAVEVVEECLGDDDAIDGPDADLEIELPPLGGGNGGARSPTTAAAGGGGGGRGRVTARSPHRRHSTGDTAGLLPLAGATHHYANHRGHSHHQRPHHSHPRRAPPPPHHHPGARPTPSSCCPFSTDFVGLLVHCLADGVALGASALSASAALRWSVFGALALHKLPTAFATGAYVHNATALAAPNPINISSSSNNSNGQRPRGQRAEGGRLPPRFLLHALAFSLASPLAALATHAAASRLATGAANGQTIGALLLFSGGSFLFVAVGHIAPEVLHSPHLRRPGPRGVGVLGGLLGGMALVPLLAALAPEGGEGGR